MAIFLISCNFFLVKKQEDYLKRALDYYFNKVDTDKNGVVTVPEFVKLALSFSEENKDDDSVVAEVPLFVLQNDPYLIDCNPMITNYF